MNEVQRSTRKINTDIEDREGAWCGNAWLLGEKSDLPHE